MNELAAVIREMILVRKGEVVTMELAAERANNIAAFVEAEGYRAPPADPWPRRTEARGSIMDDIRGIGDALARYHGETK